MAKKVNFEDSDNDFQETLGAIGQRQQDVPPRIEYSSKFDISLTTMPKLHQKDVSPTATEEKDNHTIQQDDGLENDIDDELALVENAFQYLTKKTYPSECSKNYKRAIRKKSERLMDKNGEIFYKKRGGTMVRLILNQKEKEKILDSCHRDPTSGHLGVRRTLSRITGRFMWRGVSKDVTRMVATCGVCQRMGKLSTTAPELNPIPVVSPWYHVGIDFVGPISPPSHQGCQYILTASDYFTKFVEPIPMQTKNAEGVASNLFKLFMRMGIPKVVTSDQGHEFNNQLNDEFMWLLKIDHRLSTPYHPQANGLVERFNQTIQNMLVKFITSKKGSWQDYLDTCVYAYNTSRHDSTRFTPFELMFGRQAVLPIDVRSDAVEATDEVFTAGDEDILQRMVDAKKATLVEAKANIVAAQIKQKQTYDCKHCTNRDSYSIGTAVLKKDFTRKKRKGGKLDSNWIGPFPITKVLGKGLYSLKSFDDPPNVVNRVNGVYLKTWIGKTSPSPPSNDDSPVFVSICANGYGSLGQKTSYTPSSNDDSLTLPSSSECGSLDQKVDDLNSIPPWQPPTTLSTPSKSLPPTLEHTKRNVNTAAQNLMFKQRKSKRLTCTPENLEIIDVENLSSPECKQMEKIAKWIETSLYSLSCRDRELLLSSVGWLNDSLIMAAQALLKEQSSIAGFQDPCLGMTMAFEIQRGTFVQVLHNGHGHWLTVSSIGGKPDNTEVFVYDSMYPSVGTYTKKQIAALVYSKEKAITIKMMNVQLQAGGCDCGLFAIGFATALANNIKPGECSFKQDAMRQHLYQCLQTGKVTMFPLLKPRRLSTVVHFVEVVKLYCTCRMPELPPMVECSRCGEWYHVPCVSVPREALDDSKIEWKCTKCLLRLTIVVDNYVDMLWTFILNNNIWLSLLHNYSS